MAGYAALSTRGLIMNWSDLGKTIAGYAPLLGGVVGGPAGGACC